ncbi:MAG: amino acid-binding ACT domain-containing protein [Chitinophagaceae bacterium]|nr:MAG: amino acid-binding ACT domain-containing protein [Chitinophagaceae bacterium]
MKDIEILMDNKPGMLALLGDTLGRNKISLEGGGMFQAGEKSIAHFLVEEPDRARAELKAVNIDIVKVNDVLIQKLRQDVPGQLGAFCNKMAAAGVNILVQYSDHYNQLIVVVDDYEKGKAVSDQWKADFLTAKAI